MLFLFLRNTYKFLYAYVVLLISDIFLINIISELRKIISVFLHNYYEDIITLSETSQMVTFCIIIFGNC